MDCSFETTCAHLHQDYTDNFNWATHSGRTHTHGTGPNADHTNAAGETKNVADDHLVTIADRGQVYLTIPALELVEEQVEFFGVGLAHSARACPCGSDEREVYDVVEERDKLLVKNREGMV